MHWIPLTCILCSFGFAKEMRPSEAFLTLYLTGPWKNLTIEQVDNEMYPWWTYAYLIWLVPVFLLTDFFRYKPILIIEGAAYIGTWALLLWAQGLEAMKGVEILYGLATACDVAYYSYLYVQVPKQHFKKIASFTRAATLMGTFISFVLSQIFHSLNVMDYFDLNVFSFVSVCIAFVITLILPRPEYSEIFHRKRHIEAEGSNMENVNPEVDATSCQENPVTKDSVENRSTNNGTSFKNNAFEGDDSLMKCECNISMASKTGNDILLAKKMSQDMALVGNISSSKNSSAKNKKHEGVENSSSSSSKCKDGFLFMLKEMKDSYSSRVVIIWSVWWAIASCGNFQVLNYVQNLWAVISSQDSPGENADVYNGAVEAASTLLGTISVMLVGFLPVEWSRRAEFFMAFVCAANAVFLIMMAHTSNIWVAYVLYVLFRLSYITVITIATAQIAQNLSKQRYGLVFGCNMFLALVLETILTVIVVDKAVLGVGIVDQFTVYGGYFVVISVLFFAVAIWKCIRKRSNDYNLD
ncbi:hypothetical protein ACJMK2_019130 [Sinanodonta woodiana]|uniref:Thiamine transporter 2 n=1 Tax=Sinanodonta woodiana TaxID=1069815 RepID=A0ABD3UH31_SINWO